jgi:hypothetical protein
VTFPVLNKEWKEEGSDIIGAILSRESFANRNFCGNAHLEIRGSHKGAKRLREQPQLPSAVLVSVPAKRVRGCKYESGSVGTSRARRAAGGILKGKRAEDGLAPSYAASVCNGITLAPVLILSR